LSQVRFATQGGYWRASLYALCHDKGSGPRRVIRDRAGQNRLSVNVRSSPTATEFLWRSKLTRCATTGQHSTCGHAHAGRSTVLAL